MRSYVCLSHPIFSLCSLKQPIPHRSDDAPPPPPPPPDVDDELDLHAPPPPPPPPSQDDVTTPPPPPSSPPPATADAGLSNGMGAKTHRGAESQGMKAPPPPPSTPPPAYAFLPRRESGSPAPASASADVSLRDDMAVVSANDAWKRLPPQPAQPTKCVRVLCVL